MFLMFCCIFLAYGVSCAAYGYSLRDRRDKR